MDLATAQEDMSAAYVGGAPSVFVSGVAWLAAGVVGLSYSPRAAFVVLFVGGMLIVPASLLIVRVLFGASKVSAGNPLERLGFEGTIVLFAGILIAYALLSVAPEFSFSALALAIGARYFAFRTIYGEPVYWLLGGVLALIGMVAMLRIAPLPAGPPLLVGIAESAFSALLLLRWKRRHRQVKS